MKRLVCLTIILSIFSVVQVLAEPNIGGFIQTRYQHNQASTQATDIQRLWFKITGEGEDGRTGYLVIINSTGQKLMHNGFAWVKLPALSFIPESKITVGKFVPIFGRNWPTYAGDINTINFARISDDVLLIRDVGLTWTTEQKFWNLALSVTNGRDAINDNGGDDNKAKDFYSRFLVRPLSGLELGVSSRHGKDVKVFGADFLLKNEKNQLTGELISSEQKKDIFGWNVLGIHKFGQSIELLARFEEINDKTLDNKRDFTTLGANWLIRAKTRLAVNYVFASGNKNDELLFQLQQTF